MNLKEIVEVVETHRVDAPACHHDWRHKDGEWFFCGKCLAHALVHSRKNPKKDNWIITIELQEMEKRS